MADSGRTTVEEVVELGEAQRAVPGSSPVAGGLVARLRRSRRPARQRPMGRRFNLRKRVVVAGGADRHPAG